MKLFCFLPLAVIGLRITQKNVQNAENRQKICRDCKYFIPFDNQCKKINKTNLVTGGKTYNHAAKMRNNKDLCGKDGFFFEENYFKIVTEHYYFVKKHSVILVISSFLISFLISFFCIFNIIFLFNQ